MSLIAAVGATLKRSATLSAAWSNLAAVAGIGDTKTNEDRTVTFGGSARTITRTYAGSGTLEYRINSGSWTAYSTGFSLTSGQTLAWRITMSANQSATTLTVLINGAFLGSFTIAATGY